MKVLCPLPRRDFDPSEVAIPWKLLREAGHEVLFATPDGQRGHADPRMLSGAGLDVWGFIPGFKKLKLIGLALRANADARRAYLMLEHHEAFLHPLSWHGLDAAAYDALLLPGGHAKGVSEYLESTALQRLVAEFFDAGKPVAAICHGVVLAARSCSPLAGRSVLHGRRTTALTWALEKSAWNLTRYFARFWDPNYYRTYVETSGEPYGWRGVQQEVTRALARQEDFVDVPTAAPDRFRKSAGLFRDTPEDARPAWVVRDGDYVSARWPGDVHTFARTFIDVLAEYAQRESRGGSDQVNGEYRTKQFGGTI